MSKLISKGALYKKIAEMEEVARKRVLDTPTNSPCYMRYVAQLNERTAFKHMIADEPTIEAEPVVHGRWILDEYGNPHCSVCEHVQDAPTNYCSECGADMRGDQNE